MASSAVQVTDATGAAVPVDSQQTVLGDERQTLTIGDPDTDAAVAQVIDAAGVGAAARTATDPLNGNALNVNTNAIQLPTYKYIIKPTAGALTASTINFRAGLYHTAASTNNLKIRAIEVNVSVSAVAQSLSCEVHYWASATAPGGSNTVWNGNSATVAHYPLDHRDAAPLTASNVENVAHYASTSSSLSFTSSHIAVTGFVAASSSAALHGGGVKIFDWQESGPQKPLTLRAGVQEGFAVGFLSSSTPTITPTIEITYTMV